MYQPKINEESGFQRLKCHIILSLGVVSVDVVRGSGVRKDIESIMPLSMSWDWTDYLL